MGYLRLFTLLVLAVALAGACKDKEESAAPVEGARGEAPAVVEDETTAFEQGAPGTETVHVAAAERRAIVPSQPPLDISALLLEEDVVPRVGRAEDIHREVLAGLKPGPGYNAVHLRKRNGQEFGVGLQVWKLDDHGAATAKLKELRGQYLGIEDVPGGAEGLSFGARRAGIRSYVVAPKDKDYLFALSCGGEACPDWKAVMEFATRVESRL